MSDFILPNGGIILKQGIVIFGPAGSGKTTLGHMAAAQLGIWCACFNYSENFTIGIPFNESLENRPLGIKSYICQVPTCDVRWYYRHGPTPYGGDGP